MAQDSSTTNSGDTSEQEPSMLDQTIELAKFLGSIADRDPEGHPTPTAVQAFHSWLRAARHLSEEPQYFNDVLENYDAPGRSNKDLCDLFDMLHPYVEIVDDRPFDDEPEMAKPGKVFIGLPTV